MLNGIECYKNTTPLPLKLKKNQPSQSWEASSLKVHNSKIMKAIDVGLSPRWLEGLQGVKRIIKKDAQRDIQDSNLSYWIQSPMW